MERMADFLHWLASIPSAVLYRTWWLAAGLLRAVAWLIQRGTAFLGRWLVTRNYRDLLPGLPAAVAATIIGVCGAITLSASALTTPEDLVRRGLIARHHGDEKAAMLYLRRAVRIADDNQQTRYHRAVLFEAVGRDGDAAMLMRELAPDGVPGYVPAHEWRARRCERQLEQLAQQESPDAGPEERADRALRQRQLRETMEQQSLLILQEQPQHVQAHSWLADLELQKGNPSAAIKHLSQVVDEEPDRWLLYAQLLASQGRRREALTAAEASRRHFAREVSRANSQEEDREERLQNRLGLAASLLMLRRFEASVEALMPDGREPQDERLRTALARSLALWSDTITVKDGVDAVRRLELLENALRMNPNDDEVMQRIARLSAHKGDSADRIQELLTSVLSTGRASGIVHLIIGTHAMRENDVPRAVRHLELARQIHPDDPTTLNNLAVALNASAGTASSTERSRLLERALSHIERGLELRAGDPEFLQTRGEIHLHAGHWTQAITDLEASLRFLPQRIDTHRALAQAYDAIQDEEMSTLHRRHVERLEASADESP